MPEAMPTVLPESGVAERREVKKAQLFTGAFGGVSVDETTGEITAPINPEGDKSFLGLLADRESAGGENRCKVSDDGKRTRGTFHITLETAMGLANEFPFVKEYKSLNTQNRDSFGQYMIDNPDVEREMALTVRNQKLNELKEAGVKLDQLNQNEVNAVSLLFFNTGTAKSPKLKRNLAALTNYKALFGENPTPDELDILNQLRVSVVGQMDHINTDDGPSERSPTPCSWSQFLMNALWGAPAIALAVTRAPTTRSAGSSCRRPSPTHAPPASRYEFMSLPSAELALVRRMCLRGVSMLDH